MEYSEFGGAFEEGEVRAASLIKENEAFERIGLEKGELVDGLFARCPRSIKRF